MAKTTKTKTRSKNATASRATQPKRTVVAKSTRAGSVTKKATSARSAPQKTQTSAQKVTNTTHRKRADKGKAAASKAKRTPSQQKGIGGGSTRALFAHGAGAGSSHPWMQRWTERLRALPSWHVTVFDYSYIGVRPAPRAETLTEEHAERLLETQAAGGSDPNTQYVLIGKSMGSRVGCHVACKDNVNVQAIVCFGYPLIGANGKKRDEVLLALPNSVRVLFIAGTKDKMCPLSELNAVVKKMRKSGIVCEVFVVDGGDHSLMVGARALKEQEKTQDAIDADIATAVGSFIKC